jgi:hypothetical protein
VARIIFFDLETRLWASDLDPENEQHGWDLLRQGKGGASAICLYDTKTDWVHCYDDHSILACAKHLEAADLVVGFRSEAFDFPVVEGLIDRKLRLKARYDVYVEMTEALARKGVVGRRGDFTLDAVCKRNLARGKTDHGSNAKSLAQRGRFGELFSYCLSDVELTRALWRKIVTDGGLIELGGRFVSMEVPSWLGLAHQKE